jgi:pyruvate formate lyase activating enzyme
MPRPLQRSLPLLPDESAHSEATTAQLASREAAGERPALDGEETLKDALFRRAQPGALFHDEGKLVRCTACAHRCGLGEGRIGACGVRMAKGGGLLVPSGYVARRYVRAVETNTIYHVRPGARSLTFGMYGCDLRCPYCHNHRVSQALRDGAPEEHPVDVTAEALVMQAEAEGCEVLCAAYNEPMIAAEWVREVFTVAKARGLVTAIVSDGHSTEEALAYVRPVTDVFRVDLKGYTKDQYKELGGNLEAVLATIKQAHALGFWIEVVTLVVPGWNDSMTGLRAIAKAIASLDPNIPLHLNAFQPRYRMHDRPAQEAAALVSAAGAAFARGLRFVYVGNVDDAMNELSHTRCPKCHTTLVERRHWEATAVKLAPGGRCPTCDTAIPGLFA